MSTIEQPPQQHGPYAYGPPPQWQPPQRQTNGIATGGFVTALVGAVLSIIPFLGVVSWLICPVGLVLSLVGLSLAGSNGGVGRGMGIAGILCAVLGLVICSLYLVAFSTAVASSGTGTSSGTATTSGSSYSAPSVAPSSTPGEYSDGTYLVGSEIAPGRYRTDGAPSDAAWRFCMATTEDGSGNMNEMESSGGGPATVVIRSSDGTAKFTGSCVWTRR